MSEIAKDPSNMCKKGELPTDVQKQTYASMYLPPCVLQNNLWRKDSKRLSKIRPSLCTCRYTSVAIGCLHSTCVASLEQVCNRRPGPPGLELRRVLQIPYMSISQKRSQKPVSLESRCTQTPRERPCCNTVPRHGPQIRPGQVPCRTGPHVRPPRPSRLRSSDCSKPSRCRTCSGIRTPMK